MGEVTIEIDGRERTYHTEESFFCTRCEMDWPRTAYEKPNTCPECDGEETVHLTDERIYIRPNWLWHGANSIDEMVERAEHKAKFLQKLKEDGWKAYLLPRDGYARLQRQIDETEETDTKEVSS